MSVTKRMKTTKSVFGQLVIGPPASGKTTYCARVCEFYKDKLNRKCAVVNLDPANENMKYKPMVDIMALITVQDVMDEFSLGPNGALMYCMEYLEENFDWLLEKLSALEDIYLVFDLPGQVELYTHHKSVRNVVGKLQQLGYQLCAVHLVDSHHCSEPSKFISTLLLSLSTMMQLGLPHVNILSKADELRRHVGELDFGLDFYTDVLDLQYLLDVLNEGSFTSRYKKLNEAVVSLVEDYGLVSFILLDVSSDRSLLEVKSAVDKANGYVYGTGEERTIQTLLSCAVAARTESDRFNADMM